MVCQVLLQDKLNQLYIYIYIHIHIYRYIYIYIYILYIYISPISPSSCVSLPPSLSHLSRWSQSTELISLCYAAASHQLSILHLVMNIFQCYSLTLSELTLPAPHVLKFILYICIFIPVLPLGSSEAFYQIPYICVSIQYLFFSF